MLQLQELFEDLLLLFLCQFVHLFFVSNALPHASSERCVGSIDLGYHGWLLEGTRIGKHVELILELHQVESLLSHVFFNLAVLELGTTDDLAVASEVFVFKHLDAFFLVV